MVRKYDKSDTNKNNSKNISKTMYTQALDSNIPAMPKENYVCLSELPTTKHER
jgi:hypothetical protein